MQKVFLAMLVMVALQSISAMQLGRSAIQFEPMSEADRASTQFQLEHAQGLLADVHTRLARFDIDETERTLGNSQVLYFQTFVDTLQTQLRTGLRPVLHVTLGRPTVMYSVVARPEVRERDSTPGG